MWSADAEIDASFYQMIHQFICASERDEMKDRRRHSRERFSQTQWIAPWDGVRFPDEAKFIEVQCHDLTRAGFSFLLAGRPTFRLLIAGFGRKPNLLYVVAEPVRCVPVLLSSSGRIQQVTEGTTHRQPQSPSESAGQPMMLVGCRFIRRVDNLPSCSV